MDATEYTQECKRLADIARDALDKLRKLMRENGDEVRPMDIDEAIVYLDGAMEG